MVSEKQDFSTHPHVVHNRTEGHRDVGPSLRTYALAAVAGLIQNNDTPEAAFLLEHLGHVESRRMDWAASLSEYLNHPAPVDAHLIRLCEILGLTKIEALAVALAAAVEHDASVGRAIAHVQKPLGGSRPSLGLLSIALARAVDSRVSPMDLLTTGTAVRSSLLRILGDGTPLPERPVEVPTALCQALRGQDGIWPSVKIDLQGQQEIPLPSSTFKEIGRHAKGLIASPNRTLVIRTASNAEGKTVAWAMAKVMGQRAAFIDGESTAGLAPWLLMRSLIPVFHFELSPGERKLLPSIPFYNGPTIVLCGTDGSIEPEAGTALNWTLPVPSSEERRELWKAALGSDDLAASLAENHRHTPGRIAQLGQLAHHRSALNGATRPTSDDVFEASRAGEGIGLDSLAQPIRDDIPDEALVMSPALRRDMDMLLLRCRTRDGLAKGLGASASARYQPGVCALFVGASGTGKTLAAGWLATRLQLPLYKVDLASVTSKYIGETEKNLSQLLARAEQAEVVLLFDEADSLFGKRTEVKDANDRFANAQTNYLLQRIETFDGITILTSNSRGRFDTAFSRRLDFIVEFPLPGPEERRALWQSHLGEKSSLAPKELNQLAATVDFGGGYIRNAVLTAAMLAQDKKRPIEYQDIIEGVVGEYKKLGRQMPSGLVRQQ